MRKFIRHPSDIPIEIVAENAADPGTYSLTNVSFGGLSCTVCKAFEPGRFVTVKIPVVDPVYRTRGKVVWCKDKKDSYEIGIQFIEACDAFQCRMIEQICHIEQYRKDVKSREGRVLNSQEAATEWILKYASNFPETDDID